MADLLIKDVSKTFTGIQPKERIHVLDNISLQITSGEFITIFGPNGCGKTTLLNLIAGLIDKDSGSIMIDGKDNNSANVGYVYQNYHDSLLPWRTSIDNIAFPLELRKLDRKERLEKTRSFLRQLDIDIPEKSYPYQLSAGQQQLIALCRGLINAPDVILMDEPFNGLDYQTRINMHFKLLDIWQRTKATIVFVSHDIDEAIFLAHKLIILSKKPARCLRALEIGLPYPRTWNTYQHSSFMTYRNKALEIFRSNLNEK